MQGQFGKHNNICHIIQIICDFYQLSISHKHDF